MTIRFALLGAGRIGRVHAQTISIHPKAKLLAVADISQEHATQIITSFGGEYRDIKTIASAGDIDAVLICTPTDTHADLIELFAKAGKAIFCEKPIDLNIDRVHACLKIVKETSTSLMVGFNRRFDPHFSTLKQAISEGQIGDIEMINIISRDPNPPPTDYIRKSGGIFKDMSIHDFDIARYIFDEEIESVMASASVLVDQEIGALGDYDSANVLLTTVSGKQCAISNSRRASYGYDQRIEVHGSLGMVSAHNQRPVNIEIANSAGYLKLPLHDFFMTRYTAAYTAEISSFIDGLICNTPPTPDGEDGLAALVIAHAAMISVSEGIAVKLSDCV